MEKYESNASDRDVDVKDEEELPSRFARVNLIDEDHEDSESNKLVAYIAGSALGNHKTKSKDKICQGGIAVFFPGLDASPVGEPYSDDFPITNNRVEYAAALKAIERANVEYDPNKEKELVIRTSLEMVVETMGEPRKIDKWKAKNWRRKDKKRVANVDLLERLLVEERGRRIVWEFERKEKESSTNEPLSHLELTHAKANAVALDLKITLENSAPRSD